MNKLISIIIPTYKRDTELERAILSAINQTYQNKEIIVVDDNAENPTYRKKVQAIIAKYPTVTLIQNKKNIGGALSRNEGIRNARGELIAFLDDDDECLPERIEKQYALYQKHKSENIGLVYSNDHGIDFSGNVIYQHMLRIIASTSAWLVPKEVLLNLGCFEDLPSEQDTTLLFKLLRGGYKIFFVPEKLIIWNKHDSAHGISGVKPKNIIGTEKLRQLYRANYNLLDSAEQIKNVEYNLSVKLLPKYIFNNRRKEAKREIKYMISVKPMDIRTIKSIIKFLLPKLTQAKGN